MDRKTTEFLNALNRRFYAAQAAAFSETRSAAWPGWRRLVPQLAALPGAAAEAPLAVLDLGCGNGRLFAFLRDQLQRDFVYLGVDSSAALLGLARASFADDARARFEAADLCAAGSPGDGTATNESSQPWRSQAWDFIAVFGVMHHLPGFENRAAFLLDCAHALRAGGLLAVTFWQFGKLERFRRKIVPWSALGADAPAASQLEDGDFLLSWGTSGGALRYGHFADEAELARLRTQLADACLCCEETFCADGETGDLNRYWLLAFEK